MDSKCSSTISPLVTRSIFDVPATLAGVAVNKAGIGGNTGTNYRVPCYINNCMASPSDRRTYTPGAIETHLYKSESKP